MVELLSIKQAAKRAERARDTGEQLQTKRRSPPSVPYSIRKCSPNSHIGTFARDSVQFRRVDAWNQHQIEACCL